ncbi:GNAT family N-acetyltransferase [Microbacterium sp.]|uniref:GNAT family N-acetyltransferase n=1 Tax=Microbacterium sp. TaxID=51671 RepID=UPI0028120717|nr:GNAT family N-acetyltransferase [Microbacterium sp.]
MPLRLTPLPAERFARWRDSTRDRQIGLGRESGMRPGHDAVAHADRRLDELLPEGLSTPSAEILLITDDVGRELGTVWLGFTRAKMFIVDLALAVDTDDRRLEDVFEALVQLARERADTTITIGVFRSDAVGRRFVEDRGFTTSSIQMILDPLPRRADGSAVIVTPMTPERFARFRVESVDAFADDLVTMRGMTAEDAAAESRRQFEKELPLGSDTPGQSLFTASSGGEEVGILWLGMRQRAGRPHAFVLDIEVAEARRRKGYGRAIMLAAEREAQRLGAVSMGLHVFGANDAAVALYERLGYRRVEETLVFAL